MIERLTERIWLVAGGKGGRYPYAHSLYIRDGGGVLVDCGSDVDEIMALRRDHGLAAIVMTHYHEDHFLFLSRFPDVELWASEADSPALESFDVLIDRYGARGTEWETFFRELLAGRFSFTPRTVDCRVADGDRMSFGRTGAVALVAPGHTPGHLCLHFPSEGVLFLADYDLTGFGPWYGDRPGSIDAFRRSGRMLADVGAPINVVSHEGPVYRGDIHAAMEAYLSVIDRREDALREFLAAPRTKDEIIRRRIVYGPGHEGPWFDYGEWSLLGKHLEGMAARGEVVREKERYALRR